MTSLPGLERLRQRARGMSAYLVGGAVRDLLLGRDRADLDVVVEGDAEALARALDPHAHAHQRFGTARAQLDGLSVDVAAARAESYPRPGALPQVRPAGLAEDLARRDFGVNAMAVPLDGEPELIDPHGGLDDLRAGALRVLHSRSFIDDPTRALRAARYATRLGLVPDQATGELLRAADLATVSSDRVEAELRRLGAEPDPVAALRLLVEWGLAEADLELAAAALRLLESPPWRGEAQPVDVLLTAAQARVGPYQAPLAPLEVARKLAAAEPERPSWGERVARGASGLALVLARAQGAQWLDLYVETWRHVRLEIAGGDLLAAGLEPGPPVGRGLQAALAAKLDGEVHGRDEELRMALAAARGSQPAAGG